MTESSALLLPEFVEFIPERLESGVLYVSTKYATAIHLCACGCGHEVVTPFSPTDWTLRFDGETVSLDPSIGNWSFPCRSHYVIRRNKVRWAKEWSDERVAAGRQRDKVAKQCHSATPQPQAPPAAVEWFEPPSDIASPSSGPWKRLWNRIKRIWLRRLWP